jgi:hypothetical protein
VGASSQALTAVTLDVVVAVDVEPQQHQQTVEALAVLERVAARIVGGEDRPRLSVSSAEVVNGMSAGRRDGGGRRANWASIVGPLTAIHRSMLSLSTARAAPARGATRRGR